MKWWEIEEVGQPIELVRLPTLRPGIVAVLRPILQAHGASITEEPDGCLVRFPEGTTKHRKFPVVETSRYDIHFPDGYCVLYEIGRDGSTNLCFDAHDIPPEARALFCKDVDP
jgi:hypothetical protein